MSDGDTVLGWTVSVNQAGGSDSGSGSGTGGSDSGDVIETGDVTYTSSDGDTKTYAEMVEAGWAPITTGEYDFPAIYKAYDDQGNPVHQVLDMSDGDTVLGWTVSINQAGGSTDDGYDFTPAGDHVQEVDDETENILLFKENHTEIGTLQSSTGESITWSFSGVDADKVSVTSDGVVTFLTAPDYENPTDANADNVYQITITGTDTSGNTQSDSGSIQIVDVNELTEPYQKVYSSQEEISFRPGSDVSIDLLYTCLLYTSPSPRD